MERSEQRSIVEALILASPEPIPLGAPGLADPALPAGAGARAGGRAERGVRRARTRLRDLGGRGRLPAPHAAGLRGYVQASQPERPLRLSHAALETLAVIAYRQPVTRAEIEHVRGVDAGAVLRSLLERHLVRIAGHREVPGRPLLYATSRRFLEIFGLARIEDLPTLRDLAELAPPPAGGRGSDTASVSESARGGATAPRDAAADRDDEAQADDAFDERPRRRPPRGRRSRRRRRAARRNALARAFRAPTARPFSTAQAAHRSAVEASRIPPRSSRSTLGNFP